MNILVTGGAGYIGSAAAAMLLDAGHRVSVFDSLVTGHRAAVPEGAEFIQGDVGDRRALDEALAARPAEAVLHFAAFIEAGESMRDPGRYFQNNVANSLNVIEAAVRHGVPRFVLSSTAAVYASSDAPLSEAAPLAPANVYGQTKLMIEQMLAWYHSIHGLRYAALRYFNAAGALPGRPGRHGPARPWRRSMETPPGRGEAHRPETHLIPLTLQVALGQRERVTIFGSDYPTPDGTCIRDYIHIADLIDAHLLALHALDERATLVYNLGNGAGHSVRQVVEAARRVTGHPIPAVEAPRRPGDAPRLVASSEKIRRELGWAPRMPDLEQIVGSAWEWHRVQPRGYG